MWLVEQFNGWVEERVQAAISGIDLGMDARTVKMNRARMYRQGAQPKQIKTKQGQTDDNITVNFTGLLVDRATALLFGEGVEFDLPGEGESAAQAYLDKVYEVNKKDELLVDTSDFGATYGTPWFYIRPNVIAAEDGVYPEILCGDPRFLKIVTEPENYRAVQKYVIEYQIIVADNMPPKLRRREIIPLKQRSEDDGIELTYAWRINSYIQDESGLMKLEKSEAWDYDFPPILPFKNLPEAGSAYGRPDLTEDVLHIQDAINRVVSSTNKAIRLTAFQRLWGKFLKNADKVSMGMDNILSVDNEKADLQAIDAGSNFEGMIAFQNELRDAMFTIARAADPNTVKDKVGQLTNFGLRVLYKDALDKLKTKRQLYGAALKELNRRLLILNNMPGEPGEVVWKDPLPQNESELITGYTFDLNNGIASKQTIREKRGYDEETEAERLEADRQQMAEDNENIGAGILQNFNRSTKR